MSDTASLQVTARTTMRYEKVGQGHLKIYTRVEMGVVVAEAFTFESLAEVLGMAKTTLEGRYQRGKLYRWVVPIVTGHSRPLRGFPLRMLEQVVAVINTKGAMVKVEGEDEGVSARRMRAEHMQQLLVPIRWNGHGYYTIQALADHFGLSVTTIRAKLNTSGLMRKAVNLGAPSGGGRPRKGFPVSLEPMLRDAIESGASFVTELEAAVSRGKSTSVHSPRFQLVEPVFNVGRHDNVVPLKPRGEAPDLMDSENLVASINAMMAGTARPTQADLYKPQAPHPETGNSATAPDPFTDIRAGMLAMLRMERFSDEAMAEARTMLADQQVPDDVVAEIMASARSEAQGSGGQA